MYFLMCYLHYCFMLLILRKVLPVINPDKDVLCYQPIDVKK